MSLNQHLESLDTLIVPGTVKGFEEVFIGKKCWYAVTIQPDRIPFIKYIAIYQAAPKSAITHYSEIAEISLYNNTKKYIIKLKGKPHPIELVEFDRNTPNVMIRATRYTSLNKLKTARKLHQLF